MAIILCEGGLCGSCSPSGVVCLDSDIVKVKAGQSKVMSMLRIIDGLLQVSGVTKIDVEIEDRLKESNV